jgi:citrate lyase subunit beta/citryl-CoA lyase
MNESPLGLEESRSIAQANATMRLALGNGNFCHDTGAAADPLPLPYARSRLVVASRATRIAPPIDSPTLTDNETELRTGTRSAPRPA